MHTSFAFCNSDIPTLLRQFPDFALEMDCLITCIDSSMETYESVRGDLPSKSLSRHGRFAVVEGSALVEFRDILFTGFDEVYCFDKDVWRRANSSLWKRTFTTERARFEIDVPPDLRQILRNSGAKRYASDGVGLNILAESKNMVAAVSSSLGVA